MKKHILLFLILTGMGLSQDVTKVGTTSANFLKIGPGSRAIGMGGAFVSISK